MTDHGDYISLEEAKRRGGADGGGGDQRAGHGGSGGDEQWRYPPPKLRPVTWPDKPESIPARPWLVPGLIPDRNVTMISGDGGIGKTLLAQILLTTTQAATNARWLGTEVKVRKAVGIFCEDEPDELRRRQHAINTHLGIEFGDLEGRSIISRAGEDNVLMEFDRYEGRGEETHFFHQVMNYAIDFGAQLVTLDSLHDLFAGNENSRPQARQFINMLRRLAIGIDGAVVLTAHPSLSGLSSGSGLSGSTAWNNAVRSRLYLERLRDDDGDDDRRILRTVKANYGPTGGRIQLRWQDGVFVRDDPPSGIVASIKRDTVERAFLACLRAMHNQGRHVTDAKNSPRYAPRNFERLQAAGGATAEEFERAMIDLFDAGRIKIGQVRGGDRHWVSCIIEGSSECAGSAGSENLSP